MNWRRILAIGDMHGNFTRLLSVFHKVRFDETRDLLVLLGDYIDRGQENIRCLRWAMEMSEKPNVVALRGNHEEMMLAHYILEEDGSFWLPNGGDKTKRELDKWRAQDGGALKRALTFIAERPYYHRLEVNGQEYIFCHAGLKPGVPLADQTCDSLLWIREEFYRGYDGTAKVVVGHTPVQLLFGGKAFPVELKNNIIMMDTGSFLPQGHISCMDILSGRVWQSD